MQGLYSLENQGKTYQNQGWSGKVREFFFVEKSQGKSGKNFSSQHQIFQIAYFVFSCIKYRMSKIKQTYFDVSWLAEADFKQWLKKVDNDETMANCKFCKKPFKHGKRCVVFPYAW